MSFLPPVALSAWLSLTLAAAPRPVAELSAAIEGATRSDGKKQCTFTVEKAECALAVRVTCASPMMKYSYVMTLPVGKLDPKKSVAQANAGGFPGAHGLELTATGGVIQTVTDDGQKTDGDVVVLAFGTSAEDEQRVKKFLAALPAAKKACK